MKNTIKEEENKLFEEKFIREFNRAYELEEKLSAFYCSTFSAIFASLFLLTILYPFNIEVLPFSIMFADKIFIPDSVLFSFLLIIPTVIISLISSIFSAIRHNILAFGLSFIIFMLSAFFVYSEYKVHNELINIISQHENQLFKIESKSHSLFVNI